MRVNNTLWATTNLAGTGTFCANPTDYGALFQWGYNTAFGYMSGTDDGFLTSTTTPAFDNSRMVWYGTDGVTADQGPCPTNWRLPTVDEIGELLDTTHATLSKEYEDVAGVGTVEYTSTSTDINYPTKTLVFPDSGFRYYDGKSEGQGSNGGFWGVAHDGTNVYRTFFGNQIGRPDEPALIIQIYHDRGPGFAVRCVRDVN